MTSAEIAQRPYAIGSKRLVLHSHYILVLLQCGAGQLVREHGTFDFGLAIHLVLVPP